MIDVSCQRSLLLWHTVEVCFSGLGLHFDISAFTHDFYSINLPLSERGIMKTGIYLTR